MGIDLYYKAGSAPCRGVLLAANALGVDLNKIILQLENGAHLKPEFLKINPQHSIPTLVDNGFSLWESRAIITYLANKYGKDDKLYPKEPQARALVDQRLYFDIGTLYQSFGDYFYPQVFGGAPADAAKLKKIEDALTLLNTFLEGQEWVAGSNLTVADLSIVASVSTFEIASIDLSAYPNVVRWFNNCKKNVAGYDDINQKGLDEFKGMCDHLLKK